MDTKAQGIAIVGLGAILPDAPTAPAFWRNVKEGRYSITEVPPGRWDPELYYDPDPKAPDKTYSKIGGWVKEWDWDPLGWHLPIPPRVSDAMDDGQKWALACTREALLDYGYPERPLDAERTAVIIGNALAGEKHYLTALRINFPEFADELANAPSFQALPNDVQAAIVSETHTGMGKRLPEITEDTMPGELSNVLAGRIANLYNFRGLNFTTDAACASAMAAMNAAVLGLRAGDFDAVVTGGIDRNMGPYGFVKFCKIGALSATGTRPYAEGADGFVMGEGAALFLLKRQADAERDGDHIYAVIRAVAGSSDGKGKGITAPNPVGQRLAVERAWTAAGISASSATLVEGHGTSTAVGDVVEVEGLQAVFGGPDVAPRSIALGSVKSNIGHLKSAAGAAGMLKTILALNEKVLPPSLNFVKPNPGIDWASSPFKVNTELRDWEAPRDGVRRAGVSAFGFGGTNFHAVLEEYVPGRTDGKARRTVAVPEFRVSDTRAEKGGEPWETGSDHSSKAPLRGALVIGADSATQIGERLTVVKAEAEEGHAPAPAAPSEADLRAPQRLAIDYADAADLATKAEAALKALAAGSPAVWKALRPRGIFLGAGPAPKVAFLYTGQGSQYANMLGTLRATEPIVRDTFAEADRVMTPLLGKPLSDFVFVDPSDPAAMTAAEVDLMQTAVTQPAVLAVDLSLTKLLAAYGVRPDMVMGHSLGEYGALVAAGALTFAHALEAVSARGREMTNIAVEDNGKMAAIVAPLSEIERVLSGIDGDVVIANVNSNSQAVIGGASEAVDRAVEAFVESGFQAIPLQVSHAFHTSIVAAASGPLRQALVRLELTPPDLPIVTNVTGEFYPTHGDVVPRMLDVLAAQVASPVQFVKGLRTLYDAGARVFVEVGPKKALAVFSEDVLGGQGDVVSLFTNHPKIGDLVSFNQALCGLYAAGLGLPDATVEARPVAPDYEVASARTTQPDALGELFGEFLDRARELYVDPPPGGKVAPLEVVVTGAALGLPGTESVFDDANVGRILNGEQLIGPIPFELQVAMLDKQVTRLVKRENGDPTFEKIEDMADVIKLAGRAGAFDLEQEFGVAAERVAALDRGTRLAVAAGIDALRDAGIPMIPRVRVTSKGTKLPDGWKLPNEVGDDLGVVFASAFPGLDAFADEMTRYHEDRARRRTLADLKAVRARFAEANDHASAATSDLDDRIEGLETLLERDPYVFDRRFLFKTLSMGHSQFAEVVGARGPNTQVNSACASTTQAIALAEDWIRAGRCRRVIVIAADDATSDHLMDWIGAGFLASGAAATDEVVEDAATPFDRRRHGMIVGMGAASLVLERADAARARGIRPICQVLSTATANSAFHGSRLDVEHISGVMERLMRESEARWDIRREEIAPQLVFVSHETYTPARGGSASAEVEALRAVFGSSADRIIVANTKGFTGHPMGVGIEDVVAVKSLETGLVPPVPNFKEIDPDLGLLNLSKGGAYPIRYALRLAAGFGSQISMSLLRWVPSPDGSRPAPDRLGYEGRIEDSKAWMEWLQRVAERPSPELEVVEHRLRVRDRAAPAETRPTSTPAVVDAELPLEPSGLNEVRSLPIDLEPDGPDGPSPARLSGPTEEEVRDEVLSLVAEQTGYPQDMLDLDLDLEADLGVDTVKQAEIFVALRETYGIDRDDTMKLRDFPTLNHVIGFVRDRAGGVSELIVEAPPVEAGAPVAPEAVIESAPSAPAVTEPPVAPSVGPTEEEVRDEVLSLVAEQTGYPQDMLDLDLDLEADLGVDTVKQAEIFVALRETYGIDRDDTMKLRDFPTLNHVIGFVMDRAGGADRVEAGPDPDGAQRIDLGTDVVSEPLLDRALEGLEAAGTVTRRVPVPVLRPSIDACKATGVSLGHGTRVVVMADGSGAAKELARLLEARGAEPLMIEGAPTADVLSAMLDEWAAAAPITGVYWLPALDRASGIASMDLHEWKEALRLRVKLLFAAMRALGAHGDPFLVSATRLGGMHGYDPAGAADTLGGAVTGFTKAYKRERPDALVKAVDLETDAPATDVAQRLIDETVRDPGAVEIGYRDGLRWSVGVEKRPAGEPGSGTHLGPDSAFAVTGAAGSIVSAIVSDLAAATGATFHLLDLAPAPDPADPDVLRFAVDRDGLKHDLIERMKARGERATPAMVEKELARIERSHAAVAAIRSVERAGGTARYHQVDLTDGPAVLRTVDTIRAQSGRVDVLVHAAGLEISHVLADKEPPEYDLVFDVKADGLFNLLHALGDDVPGATVVFSSVAGRFGNAGQTDYSAANDLLCKVMSNLRRSGSIGIAIDWTAWAGIGMATRGSIPKMMELAGIDMLPPEAGIPVVRRELLGGTNGEVVVGGRLGLLLDEFDPETGGVDPQALGSAGPMAGRATSFRLHEGLSVQMELDPAREPFLDHHRIDGTSVLPGVMGIESFAESALLALPGWHVTAVEDVEFLAPFKFYRDLARTLTVQASFLPEGDEVVAACRLLGVRDLPNNPEPQVTTHFTGRIRLSRTSGELGTDAPLSPGGSEIDAAAIYAVYFHGPAYRVIERVWPDSDGAIGLMANALPDDLSAPAPLVAAPRLIELCFQTAGAWEIAAHERFGLPRGVRRVRVAEGRVPQGRITARVRPVLGQGAFDAQVVDEAGTVLVELEGYETVELPGALDPEAAKPFCAAMG